MVFVVTVRSRTFAIINRDSFGLFTFLFLLEKVEKSLTANQPIKILQKENTATSARSATSSANLIGYIAQYT